MKRQYLVHLLTLLISLISINIYAHDIAVDNAEGKTIYYKFTNNNTELAVSHKGISCFNEDYSGDVVIPESVTYNKIIYKVTSIGYGAFYDCKKMTSIILPNSIEIISGEAFGHCESLASIIIPNSVKEIGSYAFSGCPQITSIIIPESVTTINEHAFSGCSNLESVVVPSSVISIKAPCFNSSNLKTIIIDKDNPVYDSRNNCNGIIETQTNTLIQGFATTTIPQSVTSIGKEAFWCLSGPTTYTIPNWIITIGSSAFWGSKIESITIPKSVTKIGGYVFEHCFNLKEIHCESPIPPETSFIFGDITCVEVYDENNQPIVEPVLWPGILYVPKGALNAYKNSSWDSWNIVKTIIEEDSETSENIVESPKIKLSKTTATIEKGKTLTLKATVTPSDLSDKSVTWKSSSTKVATVSSAGVVKGVKAGTATITCTSKATGAKATCKVTVGYVKLDKTEAFLEKGKTLTLTATVYPSTLSDRSVTWASSDKSVATVSSSGKVKGVKAGTATITCTSKATGLKTTCKVTVGYVKLDKTEATLEKGKTLTLKATVYPSSLADRSVTWKSSKTSVATVSSSGKIKAVKAGTATITCTSNATGLKATCKVTVINGTVTLNKTEAYIEKGKTTTLKATLTPTTLTDKSVTWTSSDKSIATVSSSGKIKGVKYGTATITCTSKATGASATCQVTVGKVVVSITEVSIKKSRGITLEATVYPTTLTDKSVTWTSSDKSVATVSSSGKVKGVKAGTATITCTSVATGLKGTCKVTVLAVAESRSAIGDDDGTTGIEDLEERPAVEEEPFDVYDLSGRKVANQVTSLDGLPHGIYIVNGKKMLKR